MASEQKINELFMACRMSSAFAGKTDDEIRKACSKQNTQDDSYIDQTIKNIRDFDNEKEAKKLGLKDGNLDSGIQDIQEKTHLDAEKQLMEAGKILEFLMKK